MLLQTPSEIDDFLYKGNLIFKQEELNKMVPGRGHSDVPSPTVGIGQPQWWNLAELIQEYEKPLPPELRLLLKEADFYLVRLACSFRPTRASWIEWAQFTACLRSEDNGIDPIAFDLYPREVQDEVTTDIKIGISPSIKFTELIEASIGTLDLVIQHKKLEPFIVGTGVLESNPSWDFSRTNRQDIRGSKFLHLIVKRPKTTKAVNITFKLYAQVRIKQGILRAALEEDLRKSLTTSICY